MKKRMKSDVVIVVNIAHVEYMHECDQLQKKPNILIRNTNYWHDFMACIHVLVNIHKIFYTNSSSFPGIQ